MEARNFSGFKNSCPPPQSDPDYACLGLAMPTAEQEEKERRPVCYLLGCPSSTLVSSGFSPPCCPSACPSGLLGRHHYCPQPASPDGSKGGSTHGSATSPRLARGYKNLSLRKEAQCCLALSSLSTQT